MGKRNRGNRYTKKELTQLIMQIFMLNPLHAFNYRQISKRLDIHDTGGKQLIVATLSELAMSGRVEEVYTGKYKMKPLDSFVIGRIEFAAKGKTYVVPENDSDSMEIIIPTANLNHALHGDKVKVSLYARRRRGGGTEGEVVEILERAKTQIVGVIEISRNYAFLIPSGKQIPYDIFLPASELDQALDGDKVIVEIAEWPQSAKNPIGRVVKVLGRPGDHETEMHAILAEFNLPNEFSENIDQAAEEIDAEISPAEISKRRDFRDICTFTIDPEDAKDFDDALSYRDLDNGNVEVGIHIADVTHYVQPNTTLDKEAQERGTSVYLVDRVVPMLPERLSNLVCSLRPKEDKLTYSAVFELDENANIVKEWFGRTIINSDRRFTYAEAQNIIDAEEGELATELFALNKLAKSLRENRFKKGAISFDKIEVKFHIDETGKPLDVYFRESKDSNKLIEEFMLLANKQVANVIGNVTKGTPARTFVYRIHDEPDPQKLDVFSRFIKKFGYTIQTGSTKIVANSMNSLLKSVQGRSEQNVIEQMAVRSMAKAIYSTDNIGHYGLAFRYYTHFTSPIRRYPDMMVHRLLDRYLKNGNSATKKKYENMCEHASFMEQRAASAERASIKYKQVEFMQDKIGFVFDGVISGVTEWGLYVEIIENKIEGLVSIRDMEDDYYTFDDKFFCLIGEHRKKRYELGDNIKIQIISVNVVKKQLDFVIAEQ